MNDTQPTIDRELIAHPSSFVEHPMKTDAYILNMHNYKDTTTPETAVYAELRSYNVRTFFCRDWMLRALAHRTSETQWRFSLLMRDAIRASFKYPVDFPKHGGLYCNVAGLPTAVTMMHSCVLPCHRTGISSHVWDLGKSLGTSVWSGAEPSNDHVCLMNELRLHEFISSSPTVYHELALMWASELSDFGEYCTNLFGVVSQLEDYITNGLAGPTGTDIPTHPEALPELLTGCALLKYDLKQIGTAVVAALKYKESEDA